MINTLKKGSIPFSQIPNALICDSDISCKAKAIYCYLASRPDYWQFYNSEIKKHFKESEDTIVNAIKELENKGWLSSEQVRDSGKFGGKIYYLSYDKADTDLTDTEKSRNGKNRHRKNRVHNNIDNNNTDNIINTNNKKESTTNEENSVVAKATKSKFKSKYGLSFTSDDTEQGDKLLDDYLQVFNTEDKERISSLLIEFIQLRKDKRKPIITLRMLKGIVNNLKALNSPTTADYVAKKIELTLNRGWLDVKEYESNGYNVNKHVDTRPSADDNDYSADISVIFSKKEQ